MTEGTTDSEDNHQSGANNSSAGLVKVEQGSVSGEDPLDMAGADRASSRQFADEIRQLELEGTRLMAATSNLSGEHRYVEYSISLIVQIKHEVNSILSIPHQINQFQMYQFRFLPTLST